MSVFVLAVANSKRTHLKVAVTPPAEDLHLHPVSLVLVQDGVATSSGARHAQAFAELGLASELFQFARLFGLAQLASEDDGLLKKRRVSGEIKESLVELTSSTKGSRSPQER